MDESTLPLDSGTAVPPPATPASSAVVTSTVLNEGQILAEAVRKAISYLEHNFLFRKLGVAYDYVSLPGDFPRSSLPQAAEIRDGKPHPAGLGSGMAECTASTCLLLDGYLLRLELGLGDPEEPRIMDRLIAGLIRLGTAGGRGQLVPGLAADGRSFYAECPPHHHTWYARAMFRAAQSPAIAAESQEKLRDIYGKWMKRFEGVDEIFPSLGGDSPAAAWERSIRTLHLYAVAKAMLGDPAWAAAYEERAAATAESCLRPELPSDLTESDALLSLQAAFADLIALDPDPDRQVRLRLLARKIAYRVLPQLKRFREFSGTEPIEEAILDWRRDLAALPPSRSAALTAIHKAWPRLGREYETVRASVRSGLAILLSGDESLMKEQAEPLADLLRSGPWESVWEIGSLSPLLLLHALGVERGLWSAATEVAPLGDIPLGERFGFEFEAGYQPQPEDSASRFERKRRKPLFPEVVLRAESGGGRQGSRQNAERSASRRHGRQTQRSGAVAPSPSAEQPSSSGENKTAPEEGAGNRNRRKRRGRNRRSRSGARGSDNTSSAPRRENGGGGENQPSRRNNADFSTGL